MFLTNPRVFLTLRVQVFLLVGEDTVKKYKSNLADEIEPAISELIQRAEQGLAALEKKQHLFEAKVENAKVRARPPIATSAVEKLEVRRLQALTRQREKLEAQVRGLEKEILDLVRVLLLFWFSSFTLLFVFAGT